MLESRTKVLLFLYIYTKTNTMIILPDIHGRNFWKEAILGKENEEIIFLGDYLDPYLFEDEFANFGDPDMDISALDKQDLLFEKMKDNLNSIIEFKKTHPKNVILLLGNHDLHYTFIEKGSRYDYRHAGEIWNIFEKNKEIFRMAYEKNINGKRFIFSHAGISTNWLKAHKLGLQGWTEANIVDWANNGYLVRNGQFLNALNDISNYRGGFNWYGSMVWADFREYLEKDNGLIGDYQIFGHSQLKENPFVWDTFANLDCRRAFILNDEGNLTEINGTILEKTKKQ